MDSCIGSVMQVAYLVPDLDEAIEHWARLGVGPFFVQRNVAYAEQTYRGQPTRFEISAAFAYFGDLQLELVQQLNDQPSSYKDFAAEKGFGVQHLGILSHDLCEDAKKLEAAGFMQIQRMLSSAGVETILFDRDGQNGSVIELIGASPLVLEGFAQMKAAAAGWDASMPKIILI
ncbi:VOC family protein [Pseudomonas sp. GOM7]|uniref:VOC family protein n=1 Tax=Pseudomonas sp. GOM7 TaxID=2998079 RepID=UPI00227C1B9A|nr:VOC family protein [Pseudomonas sp. GOM7]WAJ36840.1 VOC family protein [Pseudomonas sp. GOM7]